MGVIHKVDSIIGINKKKEEENKRVKELEDKIEGSTYRFELY